MPTWPRPRGMPLSCLLLLTIASCAETDGTGTAVADAQRAAPSPSATRETNIAGVVAEIVDCKRKDGVLTVQIRLRNTGEAPARFYVVQNRNFDAFYVAAEDKKYLVLRDEDGTPLMPSADGSGGIIVTLPPQGTWLWWAKYPAPPAEVKSITYITALTGPFDDVPVSDG